MTNKRTVLWRATAFALTLAMLANPVVARAAGDDATASTPVVTETPAIEGAPDSTQTTSSTDTTPSDSSDSTSADPTPSDTPAQDPTGTPANDTEQDEPATDSTDTTDTTDDTTDAADPTEADKNCWSTLEDGRICYLGEDGLPVTGEQQLPVDESDPERLAWFYFDEDGALVTGWHTWDDGTRSYYEPSDMSDKYMLGAAHEGWDTIEGKTYYFDAGNKCHALRWEHYVDSKMYYFDADCSMWTGWLTWKKDATRSYFGADGAALSGWQTVGGRRYYFDPANWCHGYRWEKRIGGKVYYFDADCHMWTGWLTWKKDQTRSYFGADGAALSGWQTVGGRRYYFDPKNWCHGYRWEHWMGGKLYYFDSDCHMWTSWLKWNADGTYSYFGSDGAMYTGKQKISGYTYDFGTTGKIKPVNGKIGYQNPSGFYQVSANKVRLPGGAYRTAFSYVTPPRITVYATRSDCVNAFLRRARQYKGTPYVWNYSRQPGVGVDCIGLVYQCAYACGMNLGEFNPWDHWRTGASGWHSHDANNFWNYGKAARVSLKNRRPGDLIFWRGHVAIYMGNNRIIEAWPGTGVHETSLWAHGTPRGCKRLFQ